MKNKPITEMIFRVVDGKWLRVDSRKPNPPTLAEILKQLEIVVDDKTQFARIYDYEKNICIWYRAYNQQKVTMTIWQLNDGSADTAYTKTAKR